MCKKKKDEVNEMEITYKVEAKCNQVAGINVEFKGINDINTAFNCADVLECAFPMVDIINEQTGEVMYSRYFATELFNEGEEMGKAIYRAECNMYL
jgi:hypothetical protein